MAKFLRTGECSAKDEKIILVTELESSWLLALNSIANSGRCREGWLAYPNLNSLCDGVMKHTLALREWKDCKDEYRCFVWDGKFTAFCEHDGRPTRDLPDSKAMIQFVQQMQRYMNRDIPRSPFLKAVVDVNVEIMNDQTECTQTAFTLVECNPYNPTWTGSVLFDWNEDEYLLSDATKTTYRYTCEKEGLSE